MNSIVYSYQEQAPSDTSTDNPPLDGPQAHLTLAPRYCLNLHKLAQIESKDGVSSEAAPMLVQKTTNQCKSLPQPSLDASELQKQIQSQPEWSGMGSQPSQQIQNCVKYFEQQSRVADRPRSGMAPPVAVKNWTDQDGQQLVGKYYYYKGRFRAGINELLPQGKFIEFLLPALTKKNFEPRDKISCQLNDQFADLKKQCQENEKCQASSNDADKFIEDQVKAYQALLFLQRSLEDRSRELKKNQSMRMEHNDPTSQKIKEAIQNIYATHPLLGGDSFKKVMAGGVADRVQSWISQQSPSVSLGRFKQAIVSQMQESQKDLNQRITQILRADACISTQNSSCDEQEIFKSLNKLPTLNPKLQKPYNDVVKTMTYQQCLYEQKTMKNEIRSQLSELAVDAGLFYASMGAGAIFKSARMGLFVNGALDATQGAQSIKSAYDECSKEFPPMPNKAMNQCQQVSRFIENRSDHSQCTTQMTMAALATVVPGMGLAAGQIFKKAAYEVSRMNKAEGVLGRTLSEPEKMAIQKAHEVGRGQFGKNADRFKMGDGSYDLAAMQREGIVDSSGKILDDAYRAQVGNYTEGQLREKAKILNEAGLTKEDRRELMKNKIVGDEFEALLAKDFKPQNQMDSASTKPKSIDQMNTFEIVDEIKTLSKKVNELDKDPYARPIDKFTAKNELMNANQTLENRAVEVSLSQGEGEKLISELLTKEFKSDELSSYKTAFASASEEKSEIDKIVKRMSEKALEDVRRLTPEQQNYFFSLQAEMDHHPDMIAFTLGQKKQMKEMESIISGQFLDRGGIADILNDFKNFPVRNMEKQQKSISDTFDYADKTWAGRVGDIPKMKTALTLPGRAPALNTDQIKRLDQLFGRAGKAGRVGSYGPDDNSDMNLVSSFIQSAEKTNDPYLKEVTQKAKLWYQYWDLHHKIINLKVPN